MAEEKKVDAAADQSAPSKRQRTSPKQRRQQSALRYITILFAAAFVLMLFTFLMERRQTEALVKVMSKEPIEKPATPEGKDNIQIYLDALEKDLSGLLGRKVKIAHKGKKGKIELEYYGDEDLEVLLAALKSMRGGV